MAMAARYRVGIIACGLIAEAHLRAYRAIPAVEVVAGADLSPEVRARWTSERGIPRMYATAAEMLERERPDVVSICTWPPLRPEMTELACAHGVRGILAEKPMAVDSDECRRMIAAGCQPLSEVQSMRGGRAVAFYCKGPEGIIVEFVEYPLGA